MSTTKSKSGELLFVGYPGAAFVQMEVSSRVVLAQVELSQGRIRDGWKWLLSVGYISLFFYFLWTQGSDFEESEEDEMILSAQQPS